MLRTALIALLFASPAFAQDSTVNPLAAAGCGANEIHFDVKTDKKQHPTAQPDAGKALVYVIDDTLGARNAADTIRNRWHLGRSERLQVLFFLSGGTRRSPFVYKCSIEVRAGGQIFRGGDQLHG